MPDHTRPVHAAPDTVLGAVWAFLMENAQWVSVVLTIAVLIVVIVPPMLGTQRKAHDTVAQSCAGALQAALLTGGISQNLPDLLNQDEVRAACRYQTLRVTPLAQPATFAVQDVHGKRTYIVTPTSLSSTP